MKKYHDISTRKIYKTYIGVFESLHHWFQAMFVKLMQLLKLEYLERFQQNKWNKHSQ
jgi:hypothetical protein